MAEKSDASKHAEQVEAGGTLADEIRRMIADGRRRGEKGKR